MEITSRRNDRVRHLKELGQSAACRRETGEFLAEGTKLFREALLRGAEIHEILYAGREPLPVPAGAQLYSCPKEILEYVSPMKNPQDILFSCRIPEERAEKTLRRALILENVQDPGNVGTVLRTAAAFGIETVALVGECADPWSAKTVRASMGAVFRQPIARLSLEELSARLAGPLYGAALGEGSRDIRALDLGEASVAIGSEGQGLSRELMERCDGLLIIPMTPEAESLNAALAASIVMWEMRGRALPLRG